MTVTGKTMAAVTPQISIAPQPPMSSTDHPRDPSRKPGFARQMTNPSYQRSVLRSCRSSTTASATVYLLLVRQIWDRAAKVTPVSKTFNAPYNRFGMRRPPITIRCECGESRDVAYGESWGCERCGRSWDTRQIPAEEYDGLLRRMRRHKVEARAATAIAVAVMVPLIAVVSARFILLTPALMAAWLFVLHPLWRRRYQRTARSAPRWNLH